MKWIVRRLLPAFLLWIAVFTYGVPARAQDVRVNASVSSRPAITVLDSTKEQDGLVGSVRRVKTETAKIELKDGRTVEGPPQLVELTTYGIKGNRIENTSYPTGGGLVGKEEYKYDERGNITEMTVRDDHGAIVNREAYTYEFDQVGNWTKMVTNLVVFENGELKREPVEVTYRTLTYYFDDAVAKIVEQPKPQMAPAVPEPAASETEGPQVLNIGLSSISVDTSELAGEPPPLLKPVKSVESKPVESKPVESEPTESVAENKTTDDTAANANTLFLTGRDFLSQHKDREALKAFKESIKLNPNVAEAYYGLGFVNFRIGRFRDAADAFKKAIALEPKMAKAHYGLSLAYQELGMTQQLLDEYRILETLDKTLAKKLAQTFPEFNFSCRAIRGCP